MSHFSTANMLGSRPLEGLRVGLIRETLGEGVDSGVASVINRAVSHMEELGCTIKEVFFFFFPPVY